MKPLFSKSALLELKSFLSRRRILFAFDYDGTLAPIVRNPTQASFSWSRQGLLLELAQTEPLAIISGRGLNDLQNRFSPSLRRCITLVGNHGLEGIGVPASTLRNFRTLCSRWEKSLRMILDPIWSAKGMHVENKTYSLSIHFRKVFQKREALRDILKAVSQLKTAPRIIRGKEVVNLVVPQAPNKGTALLKLMRQARVDGALYVGDDDTDEDVFALHDHRIFTIRVEKKPSSSASYFISSQQDIDELLETLIALRQAPFLRAQARI
jgi:trehalose 6-phosphate phosphatase